MKCWRFKFFYINLLLLKMLVFCLLWHVQIVFSYGLQYRNSFFCVRCLTEYGVWHPTHHGGCSCLSRYEWVMYMCPIRRQDRIISSLWNFLFSSFHSPISTFIAWSLLCGVLFHLDCHLFWVKFFIATFKSVYRILKLLSMGISWAVLAAESTLLFPLIPMWIGIQHSSISLVFDRDSDLFNILVVRELSRFWSF